MTSEDFLKKTLGISDQTLLCKLADAAEEKRLNRGDFVLREGEEQKEVSFLITGILRGFFIDLDGNDVTDCFGFQPGDPAMTTFEIGTCSSISIVALTKCHLLTFPVDTAIKFIENEPALMYTYNHLLTAALKRHWEIKTMLYKYTAKERYEWFLEKYPGLIDQITNKYIASFLRMSPVTLSRLKTLYKNKAAASR